MTVNHKPQIDLDETINELTLTQRAYTCLLNSGIRTIRQLLKQTPSTLLELPNFGRTSLGYVVEALDEYGLKLGDEAVQLLEELTAALTAAVKAPILKRFTCGDLQEHVAFNGLYRLKDDETVELWCAKIKISGKLSATQVARLGEIMYSFTLCRGELEVYPVGGRDYYLGDGDDENACWLEGNIVHLWVRHFK